MSQWQGQPIVFFDGQCALCHWAVLFLLRHDSQERFVFAPLQGKTAGELLGPLFEAMPDLDSMVLYVEGSGGSETLIEGKAMLRTCWLLGGFWAILGLLSFLPGFLYNWAYRLLAANRERIWGTVELRELLEKRQASPKILP